jgi:hypothetical protein
VRPSIHRQVGQVGFLGSQSPRQAPQNMWPQGTMECVATIQSRQMVHSNCSSSALVVLPAAAMAEHISTSYMNAIATAKP